MLSPRKNLKNRKTKKSKIAKETGKKGSRYVVGQEVMAFYLFWGGHQGGWY